MGLEVRMESGEELGMALMSSAILTFNLEEEGEVKAVSQLIFPQFLVSSLLTSFSKPIGNEGQTGGTFSFNMVDKQALAWM
jgi:hypothetical protein